MLFLIKMYLYTDIYNYIMGIYTFGQYPVCFYSFIIIAQCECVADINHN